MKFGLIFFGGRGGGGEVGECVIPCDVVEEIISSLFRNDNTLILIVPAV